MDYLIGLIKDISTYTVKKENTTIYSTNYIVNLFFRAF